MLISTAYAQEAGAPVGGAFDLFSLLPIVAIFVVFYFLLIRPQQKKAKEHRALIDSVRRGDRIVTGGGILGLVTKVRDDEVDVEIAEGVRVKVKKATIADIPSRTVPAAASGDKRSDRDDEEEEEPDAEPPRKARKS
jgi:preprotein translocase subunit YajC